MVIFHDDRGSAGFLDDGPPADDKPPVDDKPPAGDLPPSTTVFPEGFPEDLKGEKVFEKYLNEDKTFNNNEMFKALAHASKMVGADKIIKPGKHATNEEVQKFRREVLGIDPDKYTLEFGENKVSFDDLLMADMKKMGIEHNLPSESLQAILSSVDKFQVDKASGAKTLLDDKYKTDRESLSKEWGESFDAKLANIKTYYQDEMDSSLKEAIMDSGLGASPAFMKFMDKLVEGEPEDGAPGSGDRRPNRTTMTPAEATYKMNSMRADTKGAFWDSTHPNHAAAQKEMYDLTNIAMV